MLRHIGFLGSPMNREKLANHRKTVTGNLENVQETSLNHRVSKTNSSSAQFKESFKSLDYD